jgi:hypothetical protein
MIIDCKTITETAPNVILRRRPVDPTGSATASDFRGAEIETYSGGEASFSYYVDEQTLQTNIVSNASGNTDISAYPLLTRVGDFDGMDTVLLTRGDFTRPLNLNFETTPISNAKSSVGITVAETYLRHSFEWLADMLDTQGEAAVYTGATRNAECWLDEDLTGIPYSNSSGGAQKNSAMITPRHLPGVLHYSMAVGDSVTFPDGSVRTIIGVSTSTAATGDALMYAISAAVTAGTKVYPVAGRWLFVTDENGTFETSSQFVGVYVNRNRDASFVRVCDYESSNYAKVTGDGFADCITTIRFNALWPEQILPEFTAYDSYRIAPDTGDSGSAIFVPVADGLALASCFTSPLAGPFWDEDFVNALIVSANDDAVANGFTRPTDYTVTVAADPTA